MVREQDNLFPLLLRLPLRTDSEYSIIFRGILDMERNEMIHIAICDDEKNFVAHLTSLLNQYAAETGMEIKVTVYYDGMELIEK